MTLDQVLAQKNKIPQHIAVIMDGNGRWAQQQGHERTAGHQEGVNAVREATKACREMGVKYLTLYTFSTENWNRPQEEIDFLMELLIFAVNQELESLIKNGIKLAIIGDLSRIPQRSVDAITEAMEKTAHNHEMTLVMALNYSGKAEILQAIKKIAHKVKNNEIQPDEIEEKTLVQHLYTCAIPDPELLIRTSGEYRISNFLLWQLAYSEFYFTEKLWPEFVKEDMYEAVANYQGRERRFGKTGEQVK
ncbi:MAG: isoprenyl transferase [Bacteroidetes bacterium]|nr:isoprenyl transferase [Bacteroidota bacterium]